MIQTISIEITMPRSIKAYSDGSKCRRFFVRPDGAVLAWDDVANHYTTCHCLTNSAKQRIRYAARNAN
jgi:hypothetical protein